MTGRDRIVAAARGGETDQRPTISAFQGGTADAVAVEADAVPQAIDANPECAVLATVLSPLGLAIQEDAHIVSELHGDVDKGNEALAELTERTRKVMQDALHAGADGVFYVLDGAYPEFTTPMEYGGHFLELDRMLLNEVIDARCNVLFVRGNKEPYIDFVSDLPAQVFAWESKEVTADAVRALRAGALATRDGSGEIGLSIGTVMEAHS